jgi:RNA polymerase sigma-70 factor (ECF subfamily)
VSELDQSTEFVTLWNAHSRRVYAYIYSLVGNWADADDLFQETGLAVLSQFQEFEQGTHFGAWACRIAYHKVMSHFRERRIGNHLDEFVLESLRDQSLDMLVTIPARLAALSDCLNEMPAKDRRLI